MEEKNTEESWNKKRIFIAVILFILLAIIGYFLRARIFHKSSSQPPIAVKGISTEGETTNPDSKTNIQETVKDKINNLKQEVSGLDILEIASSSPQVQKIINDIKSLGQYPSSQAKEICRKICGL